MGKSILYREEEYIHLTEHIQHFGYLLVFNLDEQCIAISENTHRWLDILPQVALLKPISYFLDFIESEKTLNYTLESLLKKTNTYTVKLGGENVWLNIHTSNKQIIFEFEHKIGKPIELKKLNDHQIILDQSENTWQALCRSLHDIIDYDRIMIYQFLDGGSGIVIAENIKGNMQSLLGYRYPDLDIPDHERRSYRANLAQQTPDRHTALIKIIGIEGSEIDLSKTHIRAFSSAHLQYMDDFDIQASASFSIIINKELWGVVACQNRNPKYIPLDHRSLCLLLTGYSANHHVLKEHKKALVFVDTTKDIELDLKEKLLYNTSIEDTLDSFAIQFKELLNSDGLVIKIAENNTHYGVTPTINHLRRISREIDTHLEADPQVNLFTTDNFSFIDPPSEEVPSWPGIARMNLDRAHIHAMYWFRKERIIEEKSAEKPRRRPAQATSSEIGIHAPPKSFKTKITLIKNKSNKWSNDEKDFLKRLYKIINDSIVNKLSELEEVNKNLVEINSKLETFAHQISHDIKNPLTTIRMASQYFKGHAALSKEVINKFSTNIFDAAMQINDIVNNTIASTKPSTDAQAFQKIPTDGIINKIINQAVEHYNVTSYKVRVGVLHPVYGEKALLHQLFMNLINNAIKFSSKNELVILEVYSLKEGTDIVYYIRDNGIGIREEEKALIFTMFKRLSNSDEFEGTGVGMSIVKRIIDKLGARISVDSEVGLGTTFKIFFSNY